MQIFRLQQAGTDRNRPHCTLVQRSANRRQRTLAACVRTHQRRCGHACGAATVEDVCGVPGADAAKQISAITVGHAEQSLCGPDDRRRRVGTFGMASALLKVMRARGSGLVPTAISIFRIGLVEVPVAGPTKQRNDINGV